MPIDIDRFEESPEDLLREGGQTNAEQILTFLAENDSQAFTPAEIHEQTDIPRGSVGVVLSRLEERELVRHRGEYWAIARSEDIEQTISAITTARAATDRLGAENPDEWGPGESAEDG